MACVTLDFESEVPHALLVGLDQVLAVLLALLHDAGVAGLLGLGASATRLQLGLLQNQVSGLTWIPKQLTSYFASKLVENYISPENFQNVSLPNIISFAYLSLLLGGNVLDLCVDLAHLE